eukprot:5988810-Alexandrium_andersonii.AAC.1
MSASLVGSEMCIRDRPKRPPSAPIDKNCWQGDPPAKKTRREGLRPPSSCLLYTSDAADDM